MAVTTAQLQQSLKDWQVSCEKVKLQRDRLKAFLTEQREAIKLWELRLNSTTVNVDTKDYMDALHMPGNTATLDQDLQKSIDHMHACRDAFLTLEKQFRSKQSKL